MLIYELYVIQSSALLFQYRS